MVPAALSTAEDFGIDDIFTGADNFFQAYAPKADRTRLVDKLGERYEIALTDIK